MGRFSNLSPVNPHFSFGHERSGKCPRLGNPRKPKPFVEPLATRLQPWFIDLVATSGHAC